ncbi:hypothetical protein B0H19DRAFT_1152998, partial [Mycena capillaripes]
MKLRFNNVVPTAVLFASLASALAPPSASIQHKRAPVQPRRVNSLLINPDAQPDLPTLKAATAAASAAGLDLDDIQGDILIGMKKKQQLFYFFSIANAAAFKPLLADDILPLITTTTQLLSVSTQPITAVNIAFSQTGLAALNITDALSTDTIFSNGQFKDLTNLGDPGSTNWVPEFAGTGIHGVILFASDTEDNIDNAVTSLEAALGDSITKVYTLSAAARPDDQAGHEHFGFLDGISNPAVTGFTSNPMPGQAPVAAGTILLGEDGDTQATTRPAWAKDGSFLVFRQLKQLVPEFHKFLTNNPIVENGLTAEQGSALLGARMVGRWPRVLLLISPLCSTTPCSARTRPATTTSRSSTRMPSSPRTRPDARSPHTSARRAPAPIWVPPKKAPITSCALVSPTVLKYQSSIPNGFRFLQQAWANNAGFVHAGVGVDPIIGALAGAQRVIGGLDPTDSIKTTNLTTDFVVSRGGEYFFSPSLSAIASKL